MKLTADANVLLSAVIGGRARLVFGHPEILEIFTTEPTFAEVREYATLLGSRKKLAPEAMMLAVAALPVTILPTEVYGAAMAQARKLIGRRDPDDIEILALTLHLKIPLWSTTTLKAAKSRGLPPPFFFAVWESSKKSEWPIASKLTDCERKSLATVIRREAFFFTS